MEHFEERENSLLHFKIEKKYDSQGNDVQHHTTILKSLLEMVSLWKEFT
tara:strand:+ start:193 stop:339 length:147 start_codon:yes stop_codon:yes gene_type:complete